MCCSLIVADTLQETLIMVYVAVARGLDKATTV